MVASRRFLSALHFILEIEVTPPIPSPIPGQFVMLRLPELVDPLLPRPFSFYRVSPESRGTINSFELLIRVAGKFTVALSETPIPSKVTLLGPLGNGFSLPSREVPVILVAGGIGIAPLRFLAEELLRRPASRNPLTLLFGCKNSEEVVLAQEFSTLGVPVEISTEDGSVGTKGVVTALLLKYLDGSLKGIPPHIYACGPAMMLKTVSLLANERNLHAELSVEEGMACGIGTCLGCVIQVRGADGRLTYERVCREGPVFPASRFYHGEEFESEEKR